MVVVCAIFGYSQFINSFLMLARCQAVSGLGLKDVDFFWEGEGY